MVVAPALALSAAQAPPSAPTQVPAAPSAPSQVPAAPGSQPGGHGALQPFTLDEVLTRARQNEPAFAAATAASRSAQLDRSIAKSALLPSLVYHNQYLFTQANGALNQAGSTGTQSSPKFIANNSVHEYYSQGVVNETLGVAQFNAVARADAAAAIASAELEISRRGLTSAVLGLFFGVTIAQGKVEIEQRSLDEARDFLKQTEQREVEREAAHADVIKAQLTLQQRQRDLADATLQTQRAHIDLGVLLFADPRSPFSVVLPMPKPLPAREAIERAATTGNPELASALANLRAANLDITGARAAYLPDLALNYTYGIDAPQFAANGPPGVRNLGYSASVALDIPVWDWFATEHRVKQAQILRDSAKVALSATQRRLIADLEENYAEATLAHSQLDSLEISRSTARESLHLTRLRYSAGEATVLEVVDAQNSLTAAELAFEDGTIRYQLALANLQILTGAI